MSGAPYDKAPTVLAAAVAAEQQQQPGATTAQAPPPPPAYSAYGQATPHSGYLQYGQPPQYVYGQQTYGQLHAPAASHYGHPVAAQVVNSSALLLLPPPPNSYIAWSIVSLLFCCFPLGVAAVVLSLGVSSDHAAGLRVEAQSKSAIVRTLNIVSTVLGCVIYVIVAVTVSTSVRLAYVIG